MAVRILHFADAHIDIANYGRFDPETLLPVRVTDFLSSLDAIVDRAINEPVDLVLFAGDAYKDRNPHPTFQREWGKRIMRLSKAGITTLLLVGNHDVSPAAGRAHTLTEFTTLDVDKVIVADRIQCYGPAELGIPLQVITIPWIPRSRLLARAETPDNSLKLALEQMEGTIIHLVDNILQTVDPALPTILVAHANVEGARYSSERLVMLGKELVLSRALVTDPRLDYVALGHIHKHQNLNSGYHPPVVYSGSIERIDFGEIKEKKGFVLAEVSKGQTDWQFIKLATRRFIDLEVEPESAETFMQDIMDTMPDPARLKDAIVRLRLTYPSDWEAMIDQAALNETLEPALQSRIFRNRLTENRARLGDIAAVETLSPTELLELYWRTTQVATEKNSDLQALGRDIIESVDRALEPEPAQPVD